MAVPVHEEIPRRNIHVYSGAHGVEVAGFYQHGGVSVATFTSWIRKICRCRVDWCLYPCDANNVQVATGEPLNFASKDEMAPGHYVICSSERAPVTVFITCESPRTPTCSAGQTTPPLTNFIERVRNRDKRCCITGFKVPAGNYTGFEAAHVFPLSETKEWVAANMGRHITDNLVEEGMKINSVQNGFLCLSTHHQLFNNYEIGINPDDCYRIYDFVGRDPALSPHGRTFYRNPAVNSRFLPSDELLRDHFEQCVLRHVKGALKPEVQERDFDPDIDLGAGGFNLQPGSWWATTAGKAQLEAELAHRLWNSQHA